MNITIFAEYIYLHNPCSCVDVQKYCVSEKKKYYVTKLIELSPQMHDNLMAQKCLQRLNAHKFSSSKISMFIVICKHNCRRTCFECEI